MSYVTVLIKMLDKFSCEPQNESRKNMKKSIVKAKKKVTNDNYIVKWFQR